MNIHSRRLFSSSAVIALAALLLGAGVSEGSGERSTPGEQWSARSSSTDDLRARESLGFSADREFVQDFLNRGKDVGLSDFGFPMTQEERSEYESRSSFMEAAQKELVPAAFEIDGFGGLYFDHSAEGALVVLTTGSVEAAERRLEPLTPAGGRGVIVKAVPHTQEDFTAALDRVYRSVATNGGALEGVRVHSASVDYPSSRLVLVVSVADLNEARSRQSEVVEALGVPVAFRAGEAEVDASCTSRDYCSPPMQTGARIRKGSSTSSSRCTQGFHIVVGSDTQFVTAGHCGAEGSDDWFHKGYGTSRIGYELATLYANNGVDIMRVQLWNSLGSNLIYADPHDVTGSRDPIQGETVCASLAETDAVDCGTVTDTDTTWQSDGCSCTIKGADVDGISILKGDSGSPLYRRSSATDATAVGLINTLSGKFAKIQGPLNFWGAVVRTH